MANNTYTTYLNKDTLPYPFCPGCGHTAILDNLNKALTNLQLDPKKVVIVSDIGCSGLSDKFFDTNAFHGLHGRSLTYATGIKLVNPDLKIIVLIGDGGCGIGGHHLINAARRNIGITTLVMNNLNYGMTGGEHSVSTPPASITATTPYGHLEQPMDICKTVEVNGASFVARTTAYDKNLPDLISDAIMNDGFSLIDIWEMCTAYFVPNNKYNRKSLEKTLIDLGFETGMIAKNDRAEYTTSYHQAVSTEIGKPAFPIKELNPAFISSLASPVKIVIAGAAGMKTVSAAATFSRGAILAGLQATNRSQYPVTVKTGFSLSEIYLSSQDILFSGISKPDILIILAEEGLNKIKPILKELTPSDALYINASLPDIETNAVVHKMDLKKAGKSTYWAIASLAEILRSHNLYPLEALIESINLQMKFSEQQLHALKSSENSLIV